MRRSKQNISKAVPVEFILMVVRFIFFIFRHFFIFLLIFTYVVVDESGGSGRINSLHHVSIIYMCIYYQPVVTTGKLSMEISCVRRQL